ncbi:hypothetical protein BJX76DRAFT_199198 [Aspergillus varians]
MNLQQALQTPIQVSEINCYPPRTARIKLLIVCLAAGMAVLGRHFDLNFSKFKPSCSLLSKNEAAQAAVVVASIPTL